MDTQDVSDGSILKSRKAQVNTFAGVVMLVLGWHQTQLAGFDTRIAANEVAVAAAVASKAEQAKAYDSAIAELKSTAVEQRTASQALQVAIAKMEAVADATRNAPRRR